MLSTSDFQFVAAVAAEKALAAVARAMNVSPSAVSQRLAALETRLGIRLVERAGRNGILLTSDGERLANRAIGILGQVDEIMSEIAESRGDLAGPLTVIASFGFGRQYVSPALAAFREQHPMITASLLVSDQLGRLPEIPWDIIVHVGHAKDSSLICIPLAPCDRIVCAAPSYVRRFGIPNTPSDLSNHDFIAIQEDGEDVTLLKFSNRLERDRKVAVRVTPILATNDGGIARRWAISGLGITQRSEWDIADDLREGRLVRLLEDYDLPAAPVVALLSSRSTRSARVQAFVDYFRSTLSPIPWRRPIRAGFRRIAPAR